MTTPVEYEKRGKIGVITLNRPEARNAINGDVAAAFEAAIDALEGDDEVWVGVLRANTAGQERPVFCAGADLKAINSGQAGSLNTARGGFAGFVYRERKKPVIAAVDGLATAGGCEIVLSTDLVVASTRSAFGLAEVLRNLVAGAGGLFRLPQLIGKNAAMEVILTGQPLTAQRAYELGMVNRLVEPDDVEAEAMALAETYINEGALTNKSYNDALDIAIATLNNSDVLASWNFKHIVNPDRMKGYNSVNLRLGYSMLDIKSPKELIRDGQT